MQIDMAAPLRHGARSTAKELHGLHADVRLLEGDPPECKKRSACAHDCACARTHAIALAGARPSVADGRASRIRVSARQKNCLLYGVQAEGECTPAAHPHVRVSARGMCMLFKLRKAFVGRGGSLALHGPLQQVSQAGWREATRRGQCRGAAACVGVGALHALARQRACACRRKAWRVYRGARGACTQVCGSQPSEARPVQWCTPDGPEPVQPLATKWDKRGADRASRMG